MSDLSKLDGAPGPQPRLRVDNQAGGPQQPQGCAPQDQGTGGPDVHLLDYVRVLYKRRWTAITAFLLVVSGVTVYTFTAIPIFEARARLLIESDERNVVAFQQVVDEDQTKADYYQTQYNILQSRALARRTLDSLKMWEHAALGGGPKQPASFSVRRAVAYVTQPFRSGEDTAAIEAVAADETLAQSRVIDAFLGGLAVSPIRNSRLVDIKYRSPDALFATNVVNALSKNYIEQNLEYKFLASKEASDWLGERLAEHRTEVEQAEQALQRYREQNDAIALVDRENIVVQKLTDLNAAVTRAKTERIQKEAMYNQLRQSQNNPASLDSFPAILSNSFIQQQKGELATLNTQYSQLSQKLGDNHPQMTALRTSIQAAQAKLQGEIGKVVQSVRSEYQAALAQEQSLTTALNQQKAAAQSMNRKAIDYAVLERDVDSSKQIYDSLMQRAKETGVAGELKTSNIRVVDAAERPRGPVSPQKRQNLMLGMFLGTLLACGLAFFFEYIDSRIKSPEELRAHLGLSYLGLLPAIPSKSAGGRVPLISAGAPVNFSEAFRAIRTNVLFSSAEEGSRSLLVTSTGPGEGKSVVATNLAVCLAQAGQRVLLIDADMRKPRVHEAFGVPQEPGLSNLLVGNAKASESVRKSGVPNLWVLAAGHIPPNPAELVGSARFRDFLVSLKEHFEWVLIDAPPVMAVTDAALIAHRVTGVLFVVGAEMTSRHAALRAIEQLEQVNAKFVGGVLNRVDLDKNPYYYRQYYRREYTQYYAKSS